MCFVGVHLQLADLSSCTGARGVPPPDEAASTAADNLCRLFWMPRGSGTGSVCRISFCVQLQQKISRARQPSCVFMQSGCMRACASTQLVRKQIPLLVTPAC